MNRSAWDVIVGVDLDDWMRADTAEQVGWLIWLRDHPLPKQGPAPCSCEKVMIYSFGDVEMRTVPGRPDAECVAHRRSLTYRRSSVTMRNATPFP